MFSRSEMLLGSDALIKLNSSHVALFGVGGVGGFIAEALIRSGVGNLDVFDGDTVDLSNINRQVISDVSNVGKDKVSVIKERLNKINPSAKIGAKKIFFMPENSNEIDFGKYDYVIDAVDTVTAKIEIIKKAKEQGVKIISCMGTANKLDVSALKVADIEKTHTCPLARVMRRELKARNINKVKVVFSTEQPIKSQFESEENGKKIQPSTIFVPASAGLLVANEVVLDLIK